MQSRLLLMLIFIATSLLESSCATYENRPLSPITSESMLQSRRLSNDQLKQKIGAILGRNKKSWDLDQLTLAALYYQPDIAIAKAIENTANTAITTAKQRPNPSLTISPTWISNLATAAAPWIIASSMSIPIETAGKRDLRVTKAEFLAQAAKYKVSDIFWGIRNRVRLDLIEVYAAVESKKLLEKQFSLEQAIHQRLEKQFFQGEVSRLDVMHSQSILNQQQITLANVKKRLIDSQINLASAIGVPLEAFTAVELNFDIIENTIDLTELPIEKLRTIALHERPDLLAMLAEYDAAQSSLELEIANQYPNIQANPSYTWEMGENRWSLAAGVMQLPIAHQNQGLIGESDAKRQEIAVRFEALQLRIINDIEKALANIETINTKLSIIEKQKQQRDSNVQALERLHQAGEIGTIAVLNGQIENVLIEHSKLDIFIEHQQAISGLENMLYYPIHSILSNNIMNHPSLN